MSTLDPQASRILEARRLGRMEYDRGLELQERIVARRRRGEVEDQLLLLEHPHVITLGSAARREHVLASPDRLGELGIQLTETGRGGDVTYHGPGQLVGYPILDLRPDRKDVHRYLRDLESVLLRVLDSYGLTGERIEGRTGVWCGGAKVAAIGIRVSSRWITSHGFALNVSTDLAYFETIVPCGLDDRSVTSLEALLGERVEMERVLARTAEVFAEVFQRVLRSPEGLP
ncbi:MAG: lipoyl(octanoyl) transferase LipB [Gemmatimonadota bacterium]